MYASGGVLIKHQLLLSAYSISRSPSAPRRESCPPTSQMLVFQLPKYPSWCRYRFPWRTRAAGTRVCLQPGDCWMSVGVTGAHSQNRIV